MKAPFAIILALFLWFLKPGHIFRCIFGPHHGQMRIATYNLRYDSQPDRISVKESIEALPDPLERPRFHGWSGEVPWSTRRLKVAQQLLHEAPNVIGESYLYSMVDRLDILH